MIPGRTGVGKSTLQHQLIRQLVAAPDRPVVGVVDPHGDLVTDIAARGIPPQRIEDVVLLELGDTEFPIGLPLFWSQPGVPEEAVVQSAFSILRLLFAKTWSPTRMENAIFALTATLCRQPGATLLDVPRLLNDPVFRRHAVARLNDPAVLEFWADFETLSEAGRREVSRPVLYRLRTLYRSKAVRNLVCQPDGLDFTDLLDRNSIILVNLAGQAIQAEADLLGELIIARLHLAAMARLDRSREERKALYLSVDECHRFQGASLPILLAEGRKAGVALLLSSQFLESWGEQLVESVTGNIGTLIAFRCGPTDARRLRGSIRPFTAEQLEDLDRYEAVVRFQIDGATMPAFDIRTLPVDAPRDDAVLRLIRANTRRQYARSRRVVENELLTRQSSDPARWNGEDVDED